MHLEIVEASAALGGASRGGSTRIVAGSGKQSWPADYKCRSRRAA